MIGIRTMSDVWREQRPQRPQQARQFAKPARPEGLKLTAAAVLARKLDVLLSDIIEMKLAVEEGLHGAAEMLATYEQRLKAMQDNMR